MAQYAVLHIQKNGANTGGLYHHIDRKCDVINADKKKAHLNKFLNLKTGALEKNPLGITLNQKVKNRIAEAGIKRKIRADAVRSLSIMLTGSHEQMKNIESDPKLFNEWIYGNFSFIADEFGKDNIVDFVVHCDEHTPHIHATVIPIVKSKNKKGVEVVKLSAKEVLEKTKDFDRFKQLQDSYALKMKDFGLSRGKVGSKAKHETVSEYYARIQNTKEIEVKTDWKGSLTNKEEIEAKLSTEKEKKHKLKRELAATKGETATVINIAQEREKKLLEREKKLSEREKSLNSIIENQIKKKLPIRLYSEKRDLELAKNFKKAIKSGDKSLLDSTFNKFKEDATKTKNNNIKR